MEVTICIGSSCHLKGSRDVIKIFERLISLNGLTDQVTLKGSFCMGLCTGGVCVSIDQQKFAVSSADAEQFFHREIMGRLAK